MELKSYQQRVIADLERYLECVNGADDLRQAFRIFWNERGATKMDDYKNNVPGVPHVCVKVPTAGGKTFIATNALLPIFEAFTRFNPTRPKVVIWLVPSLTILEQTLKNLSNPQHPYRQRLNTHFNGRVSVYDKKDILQGADFNADTVREQLSIIVLSFDSLRARNKEDRKIFQDNGNLAGFTTLENDKSYLLEDHDETALINVLRSLQPVLIVDESHNAETDLSVEMLRNLNPSFILDLTATPRNNSNIISYVDALELKRNHMVKLPVIVRNEHDKTDAVQNALMLRRQLEEAAKTEEAEGGSYIRPIALFQAQPRTGEESATFQRIKETLIELKIPEDEIKIKTAEINELKGIDLLSCDCRVRYIITVNALKEGWDCPFAYILTSLANKNSAVDVEQVLGRVLRQPDVRQHKQELLNMSYVFTASNHFLQTLQKIVQGLNRAGFSERDCRYTDETAIKDTKQTPQSVFTQTELFADETATVETVTENEATTDDEIDVTRIDLESSNENIAQKFESIAQHAIALNAAYEQLAQNTEEQSLPLELEEKMNKQMMKEVFADTARGLRLPQFFIKIQSVGGFFDEGENLILLEPEELLKDFRLSKADININFDSIDSEIYAVDIERIGNEDYKVEYKKLNERQRAALNEKILSLPSQSKLEAINQRFCNLIGNMYPIPDLEIKGYVNRLLAQMNTEQLRDCLERDYIYSAKIKQKINELANERKEKIFSDYLDIDKVIVQPSYILPEYITPSSNAPAITKSLYTHEGSLNNFEQRVINDIANLENISFWHKIIPKHGFRLNGFINAYPDFLILNKSGKILLVEAKGDDRDNSDSERKLKLGQLWASRAGNNYRYMMVFDNNPIENAHRLADAIKLIAQM